MDRYARFRRWTHVVNVRFRRRTGFCLCVKWRYHRHGPDWWWGGP